MKDIFKDDKLFYFIVGSSILIPTIIGIMYIFITLYM